MKKFFTPLMALLIITSSTISHASFADLAYKYEKIMREKAEKDSKELKKRIEFLEKEQIRVYKRDHCQNNRACRQTPPEPQTPPELKDNK